MSDTKLLTLRDVPLDLVRETKIATAKGTGSQAFIAAARAFLEQRELIQQQRERIAQLEQEIWSYRQILAQARDAAIQLAEVASQADMFQSKESTPGRLRHLNR